MSGVRESGFGYECGVGQHKEETQLHNQEIRLQVAGPLVAGQKDEESS